MKKEQIVRTVVSLILKVVVIVFAVTGTVMSMNAGRGSFMGGSSVLMYFTIQSNIAIAVLCLIGAGWMLSGKRIPDGWYLVKFVGTVSITLTGVVFCAVLAPTMGQAAWKPSNVYTHVVVPLAAVADFFLIGLDASIPKKQGYFVTLPPLAYALYAGIGYICGWEFSRGVHYPYFFLNWGSPAGAFGFSNELPFMGCMWWILLLLAFLLLVGLLYLRLLDGLKNLLRGRKNGL